MKRRSLLLTLLIVPLFWGFSHLQASHSEGFKFVRSKVLISPAVASRIGRIENVRVALLGRYSAHYSTSYTRVHMAIDAVGSNGKVDLEVDAEKNDEGLWKINHATMQGTPVLLD
jgi:hypothetical protein